MTHPLAHTLQLLERLDGVRPMASSSAQDWSWSARCPAHDDRRPSLSITQTADGRVLIHCHAGCPPQAIVQSLGLTLADLFPETSQNGKRIKMASEHKYICSSSSSSKTKAKSATRQPEPGCKRSYPTVESAIAALEGQFGPRSMVWAYNDAFGRMVGMVVRWDNPQGKIIRPLSCHPDGWRIEHMAAPRPLFQLHKLAKTDGKERIWVVEGEKTAGAIEFLGLVGTTSSGGCSAAKLTDWTPLRARHVVILPDNDTPGRRYALDVAYLCWQAGAASVRIVDLAEHVPQLPPGGDMVDIIASDNWCGLPLGDSATTADLAALLQSLADAVEPWHPDKQPGTGNFANLQGFIRHAGSVDTEGFVGAEGFVDTEGFVDVDTLVGYQSYPVECLPRPLGDYVRQVAQAIGCDASYLALPLLSAAGSAIGNTRRLMLKQGWLVPPILWTVIVGDSGSAKTPALRSALAPLRQQQKKWLDHFGQQTADYEQQMLLHEKTLREWQRDHDTSDNPPLKPAAPIAQRCIVSDVTIEGLAPILRDNPRGVLLVRDELAAWVGSFDRYTARGRSGADAAHWLSLYNAEPLLVDRKSSGQVIHVPHAAVAVTGGIQPAVLQRVLGSEHRENGLLARLLLACPPRQPRRWTQAEVPPELEQTLFGLFERLFALQPCRDELGRPQPVIVRLSPAAQQLWIDFFNAHGQALSEAEGEEAAMLAKLEELPARLALILHECRRAATAPNSQADGTDEAIEVDADTMRAAIALTHWHVRESRRVYALLDESETDREQRRLLEWIERRGGVVTAREVQLGCRWLREPKEAERMLEQMAELDLGTWEGIPPSFKGGRPTRRWVLRQRVNKSTKPPSAEEKGPSAPLPSTGSSSHEA